MSGRRKRRALTRRILRVRAKHGERIDARANFGFDRFAGVGIGIGGKRDEQHAQGPRGVERQKFWGVAQQSDAAVGDFLRAASNSGRANFSLSCATSTSAIFVEAEARFGGKNAAHGFIDALFGNAAGLTAASSAAMAASGTGGISSTSAPASTERTAASPGG